MGFEVWAFGRADDFLHWNQIARADCLITDVRMPRMNGLELLDRLLASGKSVPPIVLTVSVHMDNNWKIKSRTHNHGVRALRRGFS